MGNVRKAAVMKDIKFQKVCITLVLLLQWVLVAPLRAQKVPVVEKELANGMRLLLVERHDEPSVAGGWVAHVGSSNERPGITGIAHLFEHMMFKGTPTIGTKNYEKDLEIMAAQERLRDEMREEERKMRAEYRHGEIDDLLKPESKTERYKELEKEFNKLIAEQREILVKNEFDRIYSGNGGSSIGQSGIRFDSGIAYSTIPIVNNNMFEIIDFGPDIVGFSASLYAVALNGNYKGPQQLTGQGTPESHVTAPVGSTYVDRTGTPSLYVKESGTGNTGWAAK